MKKDMLVPTDSFPVEFEKFGKTKQWRASHEFRGWSVVCIPDSSSRTPRAGNRKFFVRVKRVLERYPKTKRIMALVSIEAPVFPEREQAETRRQVRRMLAV